MLAPDKYFFTQNKMANIPQIKPIVSSHQANLRNYVDEGFPYTSVNMETGRPLKTFDNLCTFFTNSEDTKNSLRYNSFALRFETGTTMGFAAFTRDMRRFLDTRSSLPVFAKTDIEDALMNAAERNSYDPILDKLATLEWDGMPRMREAAMRLAGEDHYILDDITVMFHKDRKSVV